MTTKRVSVYIDKLVELASEHGIADVDLLKVIVPTDIMRVPYLREYIFKALDAFKKKKPPESQPGE